MDKPSIYVAYSGGLDSTVLLHLCHQWRTEFAIQISAIHINHHLSPHANTWAQHCRKICADLQIDYIEHSLHLALSPGDSLEEKAREQRYAFFAQCLQPNDLLFTAHQQDDQAETVLLQLLRGAGPKGLAAMPRMKALGLGFHVRPLLDRTRAALLEYAKAQGLQWIDDESNNNTQLTRNFIRHEILPLLQSRWSTVSSTLSRSAEHCAEAQALLEEFGIELCEKVEGSVPGTLAVVKLLELSAEQQRLVLRTWISRYGFTLPGSRKLLAIQRDVLTAASDRMPCLRWQGAELRRFRGNLYLMAPVTTQAAMQEFIWDFAKPLVVPGVGELQSVKPIGTQAVCIRPRAPGEAVILPRRGKHSLKNLYQEWCIPSWLRENVPLVFVANKLVCIGRYFVGEEFKI
jgi:tRNA(Ile)-lysidine synthase